MGLRAVAVAMGVFGATEVITNLSRPKDQRAKAQNVGFRELLPTGNDMRQAIKPMVAQHQ